MAKEMTQAERIAQLIEENEALRAKAARKSSLTLKVSQKGAVSMYGLGRFPVTLYQSQWERVIAKVPELKAFIADNKDELKSKD